MKSNILTAERAMLYALGFSLRLQHPHVTIAKVWSTLKQHHDPEVVDFWYRTSAENNNLLQVWPCHCPCCFCFAVLLQALVLCFVHSDGKLAYCVCRGALHLPQRKQSCRPQSLAAAIAECCACEEVYARIGLLEFCQRQLPKPGLSAVRPEAHCHCLHLPGLSAGQD